MYIKENETKIRKILQDFNLTPEIKLEGYFDFAISQKKNYYTTSCRDQSGKQFFLKVLITDNDSFIRAINKEIEFSAHSEGKIFSHFSVPEIANHEFGDFCWYLRENYAGEIIGDQNIVEENSQSDVEKFALEAVDVILEINRLKIEDFAGDYLKIYPYEKYVKSITLNEKFVDKIRPGYSGLAIKDFENSTDKLYDRLVISHGDCHLGNFLFREKDHPIVLDWAAVHLGNIANDFVKFWLGLWQYPEIQKKVAHHFINNLDKSELQNFYANLKPMLIYHGFGKLGWSQYLKERTDIAVKYDPNLINNAAKYFSNLFFNRDLNDQLILLN